MKLRSSSFSFQPNEEVMSKNSQMSDKSTGIYKEASNLHLQNKPSQLKKYNSLPCDYVSDFSLLTLSDAESMKSGSLSQISDDYKSDFNNSIILSDCDEKLTIDTASVCTDSTYGFEEDDIYSDLTYQSSIHRPVKRRKFTSLSDVSSERMSCFSGFDSDISNIQGLKKDTESENDIRSDLNSDFKNSKKSFDCVKWFCSFTLFLVFIVMLFLSSMSFCNHNNQIISLENVQTNLTKCLIGHKYSVPIFMDLLQNFFSDYYTKDIYLAWVVGGIGVGKSYSKYIIKNSLPSWVAQQSVLIPLIPDQNASVDNIVENLVKNMEICKPNIIFVDGYDEENDITLGFVEILIRKLYNHKRIWSVSKRVLIIVIGTYKSSVINSYYLNHLQDFHSNRESFNIKEIQIKMYNISPFSSFLDKYPCYFVVVPLLPIEVSHLEKCVISQLNFISKKYLCNTKLGKDLENFLQLKNFTIEKLQKEVFSLSNIQPSKTGNLVPSGCKRVYQIVSSLLYFPLNVQS